MTSVRLLFPPASSQAKHVSWAEGIADRINVRQAGIGLCCTETSKNELRVHFENIICDLKVRPLPDIGVCWYQDWT